MKEEKKTVLGMYIIIKNSDGKVWELPEDDLKTGFQLYQPSSAKGKLLKKYFSMIYTIPFVRHGVYSFLHIKRNKREFSEEFVHFVKSMFLTHEELKYSFFLGTPCVHQKMTVQIACRGKILGYCKLSEQEDIKQIFRREKYILDELNRKSIDNIPVCLAYKELRNNIGVFVQSTKKTGNSLVKHRISPAHVLFLESLSEKTRVRCTFEESDYWKRLIHFNEQFILHSSFVFSKDEQKILAKAVSIVKEKLSLYTAFSAYHGDFTPWNMFFEDGQLYVFDFEYAQLSYPAKIDIFHYFTQTALYEKHWEAKQIYNEFRRLFFSKHENYLTLMFSEPDVSYLFYLIDIIAFYAIRNHDDFSAAAMQEMKTRVKLAGILMDGRYKGEKREDENE